jgi:hypothetical protein
VIPPEGAQDNENKTDEPKQPADEKPVQCAAMTGSGTRCSKAAVKGSELCAIHKKQSEK